MDRVQFMEQLEKLLSDIPEDERREALDYYEGYFDEAGKEKEASVIQELGSPGKVAAIIKADLRENGEQYGEYTERGYYDERVKEPGQMPGRNCEETQSGRNHADEGETGNGSGVNTGTSRAERGYHPRPKRGRGTIALIIILLIFVAPFLSGTINGFFGILVTIILLPFLIIFGVGACVIGLIIGGLVTLFAGIGVCAANPAMGVLSIGIGCILTAVGLLGTVFVVWFASRFLPWLLRGFTDLCHRLLHRERKEEEGV